MESSKFKFVWQPGGFEGYLFNKPAGGIILTIPATQDGRYLINVFDGILLIMAAVNMFWVTPSSLGRTGLVLIMAGALVETIARSVLCAQLRRQWSVPRTKKSLDELRQKTLSLIRGVRSAITLEAIIAIPGFALFVLSFACASSVDPAWQITGIIVLVTSFEVVQFFRLQKPLVRRLAEINRIIRQLDMAAGL